MGVSANHHGPFRRAVAGRHSRSARPRLGRISRNPFSFPRPHVVALVFVLPRFFGGGVALTAGPVATPEYGKLVLCAALARFCHHFFRRVAATISQRSRLAIASPHSSATTIAAHRAARTPLCRAKAIETEAMQEVVSTTPPRPENLRRSRG